MMLELTEHAANALKRAVDRDQGEAKGVRLTLVPAVVPNSDSSSISHPPPGTARLSSKRAALRCSSIRPPPVSLREPASIMSKAWKAAVSSSRTRMPNPPASAWEGETVFETSGGCEIELESEFGTTAGHQGEPHALRLTLIAIDRAL